MNRNSNRNFTSDYGLGDLVDYCPRDSIMVYKDCKVVGVTFEVEEEFGYFTYYDLKYNSEIFKKVSEVFVGLKIYLFRNEIKDN